MRNRKIYVLGAGIILLLIASVFGMLWLSRTDEIATLRGHSGPVRTLAYSPDGAVIASGGAVTAITVGANGSHYTKPLVTITGGGATTAATATAGLRAHASSSPPPSTQTATSPR